jgi:hypothetical protein
MQYHMHIQMHISAASVEKQPAPISKQRHYKGIMDKSIPAGERAVEWAELEMMRSDGHWREGGGRDEKGCVDCQGGDLR